MAPDNNLTDKLKQNRNRIDLCASGVCAFDGDIKRVIYWIAAAVLNACVTF